MKNRRVAVYCRIDGGGNLEVRRKMLNTQKCRLKHEAESQGMEIVGYYEDDGFSGHHLERPGLTL